MSNSVKPVNFGASGIAAINSYELVCQLVLRHGPFNYLVDNLPYR